MLEAEEIFHLVKQSIEEGAITQHDIMSSVMKKGRGHIDPAEALEIIKNYLDTK